MTTILLKNKLGDGVTVDLHKCPEFLVRLQYPQTQVLRCTCTCIMGTPSDSGGFGIYFDHVLTRISGWGTVRARIQDLVFSPIVYF